MMNSSVNIDITRLNNLQKWQQNWDQLFPDNISICRRNFKNILCVFENAMFEALYNYAIIIHTTLYSHLWA